MRAPSSSRFVLLLTSVALAAAWLGWLGAAALAQEAGDAGLSLFEAVRMTLSRDPNVAIDEARVESSRGALQIQSGRFDPVLSNSATSVDVEVPTGAGTSEESRTFQNIVGVTQQLRTGLSIAPQLELLRTDDPSGPGAVNEGTLSFRVRQPLLRGRGRSATAAAEDSARLGVRAAELDLSQTLSLRVLTVAAQYWSAKAALLNLEILLASEASSRELLETTRRLIEADQTPAAEQVQLEANLAAKESSRIGGERNLFAAKQDLGREIGLDGAEIAALALPADPFPFLSPAEVPPVADAGPLVAEALENRADLQAARERREGVALLLGAAENALKPQLDLIFTPSYSGLDEGAGAGSFFSPLYRNVPGLSSSLGFSLAWPLANNQARGQLLQTQSALLQNDLVVELLVKGIGADVPTALDAVRRNALQLDRAREAVRLFERAVVNEEKKLRAGTSTLLDVISQRDRLTAARQGEVSAHLAFALSLLDLRFLTGTLLAADGDASVVESSRLTTLPEREGETR